MKKICILPILCLSLICTACTSTSHISSSKPIQTEEELQAPTPLPPPEHKPVPLPELPPALPVDPDIWDVSDVDISDVDKDRKLISFTFDDAPARTIENILAVFAAFNEGNPDCPASATLFCNGHLFDASSVSTLHAACTLGFELGNHTFTHFDLTTLDEPTLQAEIDKTDALLAQADGKARHLFRAPYGRINELVRATVQTPILNWTIDTLDWTGVTQEEIYQTVWSQKSSGAIVLMHDGHDQTVNALKRLLPDLKAEGYQVVSVSKMAKAHGVTMRRGSVYIRARKKEIGD